MPTVFTHGPFRFFFYASDIAEPPHVHVERDASEAKFWLDPVRLQRSSGFRRHELNLLQKLVAENQTLFLERWHEYFHG